MSVTRIISILIVILVAAVMASRGLAAGEASAAYYDSDGALTLTGAATNAEVLATEDLKFVQLAPDAYVVMKFPDNSPAQPDGTEAADLWVATVADACPAEAEIFVSEGGVGWTSLGVVADATNHEFNLTRTAMYVNIEQTGHYIDPGYPTYGIDLDAVTALNTELVRYGEITNPGEGEEVSGTVTFAAMLYNDDTDAGVQWAVRFEDCNTASATVWGNVDGHSDPFSWDGQVFSSEADTTEWEPGTYCFVFNPRENTGETAVREIRFFTVGEPEKAPFCKVLWKPPIRLENHVLNVKSTLPIKFFLADCYGKKIHGEADPELVVYYLGDGENDVEIPFPLDLKRGTGGYQFLALFRPELPGSYEAVVTYKGGEWVQPFEVVDPRAGKGKPGSEENLTGQDKEKPSKPESERRDEKPRGEPDGKPGKEKKPKKP